MLENKPEVIEEEVVITVEPAKMKKAERQFRSFLVTFIVCSLSYILIKVFDPLSKFTHISSAGISQYLDANVIMQICHILSIECFVVLIYNIVARYVKKLPSFTYKVLLKINAVLEWVVIVPVCAVVSSFCFTYIFTTTTVVGDSMLPNVFPDDEIVISYLDKVDRFDVVIINVAENYNYQIPKPFIKRVIGMPGDVIDYKVEGEQIKLYINDILVEETFYQDLSAADAATYTEYDVEEPTKWARDAKSWNWSDICFYYVDGEKVTLYEDTGSYVIPDGYYFVLGDNRSVSVDSRTIGLIHEEDIIGVASYRRNDIFDYDKLGVD